MADSPVVPNADLVSLIVKSNGKPIKDTYQVLSVNIQNNVNQIPYCELELVDGNPATEEFPISDSDTFTPGNEIEVAAGYENDTQTIFKGIVLEQAIQIRRQSGPILLVTCKDKSAKMTIGRNNAYFTETTDSDIMSKLIGNHGLSADVSSTSNQLKEVIQYYATDWDFLLSRAEINGMTVTANDGKVSVKNPDEETDIALTLTYGYDIFEFQAAMNAESQLKTVKSNAWDYKSQEISTGESSLSNLDLGNISGDILSEVIGLDNYTLQSAGFLESDMLTTWAEAQSIKSKYAKIKGMVKFQGNAAILPGKRIELKGVGKRFSGTAFVSGITHDISNGNWVTTAMIGLSIDWFTAKVRTEAPIAAGLLPGVQGLQVGKVKQIYEDPDGEFRVLVTLPLIQSGDEGVWARLATFYATAESGAFFYPEVDDEVVVGFFNDDPRYPVILGSMYSSSRTAPETPDENNSMKALVTKSKMKITFDEEKKVISITTPGNN
ncbi:MAG: type VI secretion system tip protein VgrG [Saprospiraceae bacterium]|nr:type VI secretion system tip protein VgrG [Saprospiraceae bacterium]